MPSHDWFASFGETSASKISQLHLCHCHVNMLLMFPLWASWPCPPTAQSPVWAHQRCGNPRAPQHWFAIAFRTPLEKNRKAGMAKGHGKGPWQRACEAWVNCIDPPESVEPIEPVACWFIQLQECWQCLFIWSLQGTISTCCLLQFVLISWKFFSLSPWPLSVQLAQINHRHLTVHVSENGYTYLQLLRRRSILVATAVFFLFSDLPT